MKSRVDYEQRFERALRRIVNYRTPDQLRRSCEKDYGLSFEEAIEMSFENIQNEARVALFGYRKKRSAQPPSVDAVAKGDEVL